MLTWWNELSTLQQIFGVIAIPSTLVLIIQIILFLVGFSNDASDADLTQPDFHVHDLHPDDPSAYNGGLDQSDVDAIKLFTVRSIVAFFSVGGWTGLVLDGLKLPVPGTIVLSAFAGWCALYFVTWSIRMAFRMQASGNVQLNNAIGKTGEVYMTVPSANKGKGKVNVIVQERYCEFEATTPLSRDIKTGETVVVMGVQKDYLVVMPHEDQKSIEEGK